MNHYSEHIIELFIRNSIEVEPDREAILRHLKACAGCRELAQEIHDFYIQAEDAKKLLVGQSDESTSLVMEAHIEKRHIFSVYIPNSFPVRLVRFVKKKPITSSIFVLGFIALCFISINTIQKRFEANPAYYEYNIKNNSLVVFDKNDTKLWEKRIKEDAASINDFAASSILYRTLTADVDNDGKKEIVSILSFASDEKQSTKARLFDGKGNNINTYNIPFQKIQYKSKLYETEFYPSCVVFGGNKKQSLFVSNNNGRSPSVVVRYDGKGNILGTYWHYGQTLMIFFDVNHDGHDELILNGINDTEDETNGSFATTIILDPDKVVGNCESSATRGFGFPSSNAELCYIRYPNPEIVKQLECNLGASNSTNNKGDKLFRVLNRANFEQSSIAIEYFIDSTFTVKDVKFDAGMLIKHSQLYKEGKLMHPVNDEYIKSLKEAVLYWNGSTWVNTPAKIIGQLSLK